jgi:hypothetical protein
MTHDDRFTVFIRYDANHRGLDATELPVAFCATYEDARRVRQALQGTAAGDCVIRYEGPTGGGD